MRNYQPPITLRAAREALGILIWLSVVAQGKEVVDPNIALAIPAELADVEFGAACTVISPTNHQGGNSSSTTVVGTFDVRSGRVNALRTLRNLAQVAFDHEGNIYAGDCRYSPDAATWRAWTTEAFGRVPSHIGGCITFDSRRAHLWIRSSEDRYYRFDTKAKRWLGRTSFEKGLACLVYDSDRNRLLAIQGGDQLLSMSPDGEVRRSVPINPTITLPQNGMLQAVWLKGYVVAITPTVLNPGETARPGSIFVIDARTGTVAHTKAYQLLNHNGKPLEWITRPPTVEMNDDDPLARLETDYKSFRESLATAENIRIKERFAELREHLAGDYGTVRGGSAEIHVIGVDTADRAHDGKRIETRVAVRHRCRPIILVLSSTHGTRWAMTIDDDARVERLFICGPPERSRVDGVPAKLKIERFPASWDSELLPPFSGETNSVAYPANLRLVLKANPMTVQLFRGEPKTVPAEFAIGPDSEAWRSQYVASLRRDLESRLVTLKNAGRSFVAAMPRGQIDSRPAELVVTTSIEHQPAIRSWWGSWTASGPKQETHKPLDIRAALVADGGPGKRFISDTTRVFRLDDKTGQTEPLAWDGVTFAQPLVAGLAVGPERHVFAVLLDESRNSNFVHVREQRLYHWDDAARRWIHDGYLFAPLAGLAYDEARGVFYSLLAPMHRGELSYLLAFTRQGIRQGAARLTQRHPWHPRYGPPQLIMVGDRLVMIMPPRELRGFDDGPPSSEIYVADPITGQTAYSGSFRAEP